jgi:hypothetical protein
MRYTPCEFIEKLNDLWTKHPDLTIGSWNKLDLRAGGKKLKLNPTLTKKERIAKRNAEIERAILNSIDFENLGCHQLRPLSYKIEIQADSTLKVDWCLQHFNYVRECPNHDVLDSELMFNAFNAGFIGKVNVTVHDEGSTWSTSYEFTVK